jgi:phage shock protein C
VAERLYRSRDDRMLAGVAAGVAETLDADPSLIRIAWALLTIFTGGIAFVVYIVMAIIVPEAPAGWSTMAPPGPPVRPAAGQTPAEPVAGDAPATVQGIPGAPDVAGATGPLPGTLPITPPGTPSDSGWSSTAPAATPPPSYWASERDTRRAARRARREAGDSGRGGLVIGIILIVLGGVFLIREFVPWFDWHLWWPVGLIALGGLLLVVALRPGRSSG